VTASQYRSGAQPCFLPRFPLVTTCYQAPQLAEISHLGEIGDQRATAVGISREYAVTIVRLAPPYLGTEKFSSARAPL
jgi:hypothetical protein